MNSETIILAPMQLSRKDYFRLLVLIALRKRGWLYVMLIAMGLLLLVTRGSETIGLFLALLSLVYPLFVLAWLYVWALRKDNERVYEQRNFVLDHEKLVGTTSGGVRSEVPWSYIQRTEVVDGRYLLYISAGQMIILDKVAFPDKSAEQRLLEWVAVAKIKS